MRGLTGIDVYGDPSPDAEGPLAGVVVIDLTRARSGPTCVRQLADLGADVIAIVAPSGGGPFSS